MPSRGRICWVALSLALGCGDAIDKEDALIGDDESETGADDPDEGAAPDAPEACAAEYDSRPCGDGIQFCHRDPDDYDGSEGLTWGECVDDTVCPAGAHDYIFPCDYDCLLDGRGVPYIEETCGFTPLVLRFTETTVIMLPEDSNTFDLDGRGGCLSSDWPSADTPWLAIDLDGDGAILDGRELFGSGTRMPDGGFATDGFSALAPLDTNRDRQIDRRDPAFSSLVLWRDEDADRVGTLPELTPLARAGVTSIPLDYTRVPECDARGNCALERSAVHTDPGRAFAEVVDLHLPCR